MIDKFKFRCYKILPLVYDEALSYYEVLCKLTEKIDECVDLINEGFPDISQLEQEVNELKETVQTLQNTVTEDKEELEETINGLNNIIQTLQGNVEDIEDELSIKGKVMVDSDIAAGDGTAEIANVNINDCTLVKVFPKNNDAPAIICGVTIGKGGYDSITGVGYDIADNGVRYVINMYINAETNRIIRNRSYLTSTNVTHQYIIIERIEAVM